MNLRVALNPDLLAWALERAGLTVDAVRDRYPDVDDWLLGTRQPLLKELEDFAKTADAPFGCLFLPEAPENWPAPGNHGDVDGAVVEIDDEGGVVVPMALWNALGIAEGDRVGCWLDGDALRLGPVSAGEPREKG